MASMRLGVRPISRTLTLSRPRYSAIGWPTGASGLSTMIPSWLLPRPSSSSAQIMPSEASPRSADFLITNALSLPQMCSSAPTMATATFWPWATLAAPQTIFNHSGAPTSTWVTRRRSALGCWRRLRTSPTTTWRSPPGTASNTSAFSTSSPVAVSRSLTSVRLRLVGR